MNLSSWLAFVFATFSFFPAVVMAVDRHSATISVEVDVPKPEFYAIAEGGWNNDIQRMAWEPTQNTLGSLTGKVIKLKSTIGQITVRGQGVSELRADLFAILLNVTLSTGDRSCYVFKNGLPTGDCVLFSQNDVDVASRRVLFNVSPVEPVGGYKNGLYQGALVLVFESNI